MPPPPPFRCGVPCKVHPVLSLSPLTLATGLMRWWVVCWKDPSSPCACDTRLQRLGFRTNTGPRWPMNTLAATYQPTQPNATGRAAAGFNCASLLSSFRRNWGGSSKTWAEQPNGAGDWRSTLFGRRPCSTAVPAPSLISLIYRDGREKTTLRQGLYLLRVSCPLCGPSDA